MNTPLPPHVRKAPARKAAVPTKSGTMFEYLKFWGPFVLTILGVSAAFISRISVLEAKFDAQAKTIIRLEEKTLGRDALAARFESCRIRHEHTEQAIAKVETKLDTHIANHGGK